MKIWQNVFVCITDDACFWVGVDHNSKSARKGNNYVPNDYRPFQCCPTKLERATRVPKMTAQKLSHKKDTSEKSRFEFSDASSSSTSTGTTTTTSTKTKKEPVSSTKSTKSQSQTKASSTSTPKKPAAATPKKVITKSDEDDVVLIKEAKKTVAKPKETNKAKPGQKGLLGIAKIVNWFWIQYELMSVIAIGWLMNKCTAKNQNSHSVRSQFSFYSISLFYHFSFTRMLRFDPFGANRQFRIDFPLLFLCSFQ